MGVQPPPTAGVAPAITAAVDNTQRKLVIDQAVVMATELAREGKMDVRTYNAHILAFASEYAEVGFPKNALDLLSSIPADYVKNHLVEDAVDNPFLEKAASDVAAWLLARGYVDRTVGEEPMFLVKSVGIA